MADITEGLPAMTDIIHFISPGINFDTGGCLHASDVTAFLTRHGVTNIIYNPESADDDNAKSQLLLTRTRAYTSTSISVLNILPSLDERIDHIRMMKKYTRSSGLFIFKIYEGNHSGIISRAETRYPPLKSYEELLKKEFCRVLLYGNRFMFVCSNSSAECGAAHA